MSEQHLLESLFGKQTDIDSLREDLTRLQNLVSANTAERNVGNPLGGPIRTEVAPGLLPIGPYRQDVDATYSLEFTLWLSDELLRIRKMTIHLTPKPSRLSVGVVGASDVLTSEATGTTIIVSAANHVHLWAQWASNTALTTGTAVPTTSSTPSATIAVAASPHGHAEQAFPAPGVTLGDTSPVNVSTGTHVHSASSATVPVVGNFSKWGAYDSSGSATSGTEFDMIPSSGHDNSFFTSAAESGDTAVPTSDHVHDVPAHTHPITLDISESGMADNLHLYIDAVDRSGILGGPWTTASSIVLDPNLLQAVGFVDARLNPVTGAHVIKVTSTAAGAIEVVGDYSVIIKAVQ